jgi:hypothetical protein
VGERAANGSGGFVLLTRETIEQIIRILRMFGLDVKAEQFGQDRLAAKFEKVTVKTVGRLDKDGVTPANLSDSDDEKRQLVRAAEYLLWKHVVISVTGRTLGANLVADFIRDRHDDNVVPRVQPLVNAGMTTTQLVDAVKAAELGQTF